MNPNLKSFSTDVDPREESDFPPEEHFHILLAEDDDILRETLKNFLNHPQRILSPYKNGQDAIEALKKSYIDMVITDLMMPGADGLTVLKQAKVIQAECVVILMTGYASLDTALQAIRGGAYDYIRKPFKLEELEIVVNHACEKISLTRENKRLLRRLKEIMEENRLPIPPGPHPEKGYRLPSKDLDDRISGINVILNQMIPPNYDFKKKENREKTLQDLEKLIELRKEGFIDGSEFFAIKKMLLQTFQD
jgi:CheY-like chemotaxis protein